MLAFAWPTAALHHFCQEYHKSPTRFRTEIQRHSGMTAVSSSSCVCVVTAWAETPPGASTCQCTSHSCVYTQTLFKGLRVPQRHLQLLVLLIPRVLPTQALCCSSRSGFFLASCCVRQANFQFFQRGFTRIIHPSLLAHLRSCWLTFHLKPFAVATLFYFNGLQVKFVVQEETINRHQCQSD